MNTGNYDQVINFVSYDDTVDDSGGFPVTRLLLLNTYASIDEVRSFSETEQRQRVLTNIFDCRIKYRASFEPTNIMFIEWSGYTYVISSVDLFGTRHKREYVMRIEKGQAITTT
jgi:hypothetical protein